VLGLLESGLVLLEPGLKQHFIGGHFEMQLLDVLPPVKHALVPGVEPPLPLQGVELALERAEGSLGPEPETVELVL
jgi:hypothetical protein